MTRLCRALIFAALALLLLVAVVDACTTDAECGSADQPGRCVSGICQCGVGHDGDQLVDPTACTATCTPPAVPDSIAFLNEPTVGLVADSGNLVLTLDMDVYDRQNPSSVAWNHPTTGAACALMPDSLGQGKWSQAIINGAGECDSQLIYTTPFAPEVAQNCWEALPDSQETGAQYAITFANYRTTLEVDQTGLAPFGQSASRSLAQRSDTLIQRIMRREYTISVATQFTPSTAPFLVVAGGAIRYRLVGIEYDVLNDKIIVRVETQTDIKAKVASPAVDGAASTDISTVVTAPSIGACDPSSPAGFCNQFITLEFSDDPCLVTAAELVMDVELQCADGSDPTTCGFVNLPTNNIYSLTQLLLDYDACPRVIEYGIDAAASFMRLHTDVPRSAVLAAPAEEEDTLYGRISIEPSANGLFQSVTLSSLNVVQVASPANVDLGNQLTSTFMTLISPATSNSASNPIWDFDLTIDGAFFDTTQSYFLEATLDLVFANTGALTKRLQIPLVAPALSKKTRTPTTSLALVVARADPTPPPQEQGGVYSSTFRLSARAAEEEAGAGETPEGEQPAGSGPDAALIGGIVGGVVAVVAAALVVVVVVLRKRRKQRDEQDDPLTVITTSTESSEV